MQADAGIKNLLSRRILIAPNQRIGELSVHTMNRCPNDEKPLHIGLLKSIALQWELILMGEHMQGGAREAPPGQNNGCQPLHFAFRTEGVLASSQTGSLIAPVLHNLLQHVIQCFAWKPCRVLQCQCGRTP